MILRCVTLMRRLGPVVGCCLAIVGCASYPGGQLPKRSPKDLAAPANKPSVDYSLRFLTQGTENAFAVKLAQARVDSVFAESRMFASARPATGTQPVHFDLVLENRGDVGMAVLSGVVCGLTLTLVPGRARDDYILTADVTRDGTLIRQYRYEEHVATWIQLFLIFLTPSHRPDRVVNGVIDNMLLNFLYDLQHDKLLEPAARQGG